MSPKHQKARPAARGITTATARRLILALPGITEGRSYGMPSFLLAEKFFARFRDEDTVLVLQLGSIMDRDVLMQLHPGACFFTDHYRDYPAVLIRLAEIPRDVLADILQVAWEDLSATRTVPARRPPKRRAPRTSRPGKR